MSFHTMIFYYNSFAGIGAGDDVGAAGGAVSVCHAGEVALSFLLLRLLEVDAVQGEGCSAERTFPSPSRLS